MILLKTGRYSEANPAMTALLSKPFLVILIKLVLVGLLIIWILIRMKKATAGQLALSGRIIGIAAGLYLAVNVMHIFWTVQEIM